MLPPKQLDQSLRPYATGTQWDHYVAWCSAATMAEAAQIAHTSPGAVRRSLKKIANKAFVADHKIITEAPPIPLVVDRVSTYRRGDGSVIGEWTSRKRDDAEKELLWEQMANALAERVPVKPLKIPFRPGNYNDDLMAVYPVGDHHNGMLAWARETLAANYDLDIASSLLRHASSRLMAGTNYRRGLIAVLGDYFHYDSYAPVTPQHRNLLDAEGRFPKMIKVGWEMLEAMIDTGLEHHETLYVVCSKGNHDESTVAVMVVFLKRLYRDNPRVVVDDSPAWYHYHEWGSNLIGITHGNNCKLDQLPALMAHDQHEAWGRTRHRLWLTGHIHKETRKEFPGCIVESFPVLPPLDAYAARAGYRSKQSMQAIVLHKEYGEVTRHTVRPEMFE